MLTLPNGDKWILDDSELPATDLLHLDLPAEVSAKEFVQQLVERWGEIYPRKGTKEFHDGLYWDCNFNVCDEVLGTICTNYLKNIFFKVYEMPWKEILVVYAAADEGGYEVTTKIASFASEQE